MLHNENKLITDKDVLNPYDVGMVNKSGRSKLWHSDILYQYFQRETSLAHTEGPLTDLIHPASLEMPMMLSDQNPEVAFVKWAWSSSIVVQI